MKLTAQGQLYVVGVSAAGLIVLWQSLTALVDQPLNSGWLVLAGLTLLSGSFTVKVPSLQARLSVSETFVFTAVLLFGAPAGTVTVALDTLVVAWGARRRSRQPLRILFNLCAAALSIWTAGQAFFLFAGIPPLVHQPAALPVILLPLIALTIVYFTLNSALVAIALSFERGEAAFWIWRKNFLWLSVNYFGGASVAALLVSYTRTVDLAALGIIVPLIVISYLTFKTSLGRIEDATRHVDEVNKLYMSTIETLATAIDAKDQVTHGHIRRVQRFAVSLARELGIKDHRQLKAIEAAALLHDMGKLVVPEHILNKPGRLTPGEFDKMKLHASVGAEILSSINFPYPVVPIVRHHHENWDGSGYPDGIRSVEIPIGARILSVVDCFDALTSDRPYRRRLPDEEAVAILMQRRGVMYDPLVVDIFIRVKDKLAASQAAAEAAESEMEALLKKPRKRQHVPTPVLTSRVAIAAASDRKVADTVDAVLASICEATGASGAVLFVKDPDTDEIVSIGARRRHAPVSESVTISLGSGISGWVAANGKAIINADAHLDQPVHALGFVASRCLAVPLRSKNDTIGVVSAYLDDARGFSERDVTFLEGTARTVEASSIATLLESALAGNQLKPPQPSTQTIH
ncbi:MAG: HD domain-containing protein [Acidobacteria bacterium]|nr:HD domain-containing protein [Acidobacteriota bacterium]